MPEFIRGSIAENLPWFFFRKRAVVRKDFESIILKYSTDPEWCNEKVLSFTYWAWAKQHQGKKYRTQSLLYLKEAIRLDPDYRAGRKRAEQLKNQLTKIT